MEGGLGVLAKVVSLESVLILGELSKTAIPMISEFSRSGLCSCFSAIGPFQNTRALVRGFMCLNNEDGLSNYVDAKASHERHGVSGVLSMVR